LLLFRSLLHHRHLHSFPTRRSSDLNIKCFSASVSDRAQPSALRLPWGLAGDLAERSFPSSFELWFVSEKANHIRTPELVCKTMSDRKSTRLNSSHVSISYAVFCLKK